MMMPVDDIHDFHDEDASDHDDMYGGWGVNDGEQSISRAIEVMFSSVKDRRVKDTLLRKLRSSQTMQGGSRYKAQPAPNNTKNPRRVAPARARNVSATRGTPTNLRKGTNNTQNQNLSFKEIFTIRSFEDSAEDTMDVRQVIQNMLNSPEGGANVTNMTADMVLAYLVIGASERRSVLVESRSAPGDRRLDVTQAILSESNDQVLCYTTLSPTSNTFVLGSTAWINLTLLKSKIEEVKSAVAQRLDICKRLSEENMFRVVTPSTDSRSSLTLRGGNSVASSPNSVYHDAESDSDMESISGYSDSREFGELEERELPDLNIGYDFNKYDLLKGPLDLSFGKGNRHVIKITYFDDRDASKFEPREIVVKVGMIDFRSHFKKYSNDPVNESFEKEADVYRIFKRDYFDFYDDNVLQFYGSGKVNENDEVRFVDGSGTNVLINLIGPMYVGNTYLALEYCPSYVTSSLYLKSCKDEMDEASYRKMSAYTVELILGVHRSANELCSFGHGDLHADNVLIDCESFRSLKMFDFNFSSIKPSVEKVGTLELKDWVNDVYDVMYDNEYMRDVVKHDEHGVFDPQYMWYMDSIRLIMDMKRRNLIDHIDNAHVVTDVDDMELTFVIQSIVEMIPTDEGINIKRWHNMIWNGYQESDEFVSEVYQRTYAKLIKHVEATAATEAAEAAEAAEAESDGENE